MLPFLLPTFYLTLLGNVGIYALVALGLVLLTGVAGSTSFGQAAFMGVGAYTSAVLCLRFGLSPWLTLLAAVAVTGLVALILGAITLRMQGHFLPLATIAWGLSLYYTFGNAPFTGGFTGLTGVPPISLFGTALNTPSRFYWLVWAVLALCAWVTQNLLAKPHRAGHAGAARRRHGGRELRGQHLRPAGADLFALGGAGGGGRLALRARAGLYQPHAVRLARRASNFCSWRWWAAPARWAGRFWARG